MSTNIEAGGADPEAETRPTAPGAKVARRSPEFWDGTIDTVVVIILAVASMLVAWGGYQAGLWGQKQSASFTEAERLQIDATRATTIGYQVMQIDIAMFLNWLNAFKEGNMVLATFYEDRFSPQFAPAFAAWQATNPLVDPSAPKDPFRMSVYTVPQLQSAAVLDEQAGLEFSEAERTGAIGDAYVLSTLLLAVVLFCGGISTKVGWRPAQLALLGTALVLLIYCGQDLGSLPDGSQWGLTPFWG